MSGGKKRKHQWKLVAKIPEDAEWEWGISEPHTLPFRPCNFQSISHPNLKGVDIIDCMGRTVLRVAPCPSTRPIRKLLLNLCLARVTTV